MSPNIVSLLYLVAGVLFILSLRGLSSPETSRQGNLFGMIGMAIAIVTTLAAHPPAGGLSWLLVILGIAHRRRHRRGDRAQGADDLDAGTGRGLPFAGRHGGGAGRGRCALCAGGVRHRAGRRHQGREPRRNVARHRHRRHHLHRLDHRLPEIVGPHERRADHAAGAACHQYRARRRRRRADRIVRAHRKLHAVLAAGGRLAAVRRAHHHPDRRRRHAGRDLDAEFLFRLGRGRHRLHARQYRADHHRRAGRLVGRDPVLHHVQGHEPLLHLRHPRRLRRRGGGTCGRRRSSGR